MSLESTGKCERVENLNCVQKVLERVEKCSKKTLSTLYGTKYFTTELIDWNNTDESLQRG